MRIAYGPLAVHSWLIIVMPVYQSPPLVRLQADMVTGVRIAGSSGCSAGACPIRRRCFLGDSCGFPPPLFLLGLSLVSLRRAVLACALQVDLGYIVGLVCSPLCVGFWLVIGVLVLGRLAVGRHRSVC